jgi:hypothetical protein
VAVTPSEIEAISEGDDVGVDRFIAPAPDRDREARLRRRLDAHVEARRLAREHRVAAARPQPQVREVAPRVQHRHARHAGEQEREHESEGQRVVDRGQQQDQHGEGEGVALARGQDEDAPLRRA